MTGLYDFVTVDLFSYWSLYATLALIATVALLYLGWGEAAKPMLDAVTVRNKYRNKMLEIMDATPALDHGQASLDAARAAALAVVQKAIDDLNAHPPENHKPTPENALNNLKATLETAMNALPAVPKDGTDTKKAIIASVKAYTPASVSPASQNGINEKRALRFYRWSLVAALVSFLFIAAGGMRYSDTAVKKACKEVIVSLAGYNIHSATAKEQVGKALQFEMAAQDIKNQTENKDWLLSQASQHMAKARTERQAAKDEAQKVDEAMGKAKSCFAPGELNEAIDNWIAHSSEFMPKIPDKVMTSPRP